MVHVEGGREGGRLEGGHARICTFLANWRQATMSVVHNVAAFVVSAIVELEDIHIRIYTFLVLRRTCICAFQM